MGQATAISTHTYQSVVQESTKESPFFLLYGRDPRLRTGTLPEQSRTTYLVDLDNYRTELVVNLKKAWELTSKSIKEAQQNQYNKQSTTQTYHVGDWVMVFMPSNVTGKDGKLVRPYHGPFRIINLTQTNAEVQLVECPQDQTIFVVIAHLRCYPELSDSSWTSWKGKNRKHTPQDPHHLTEILRTSGPITRSMTSRLDTNPKQFALIWYLCSVVIIDFCDSTTRGWGGPWGGGIVMLM